MACYAGGGGYNNAWAMGWKAENFHDRIRTRDKSNLRLNVLPPGESASLVSCDKYHPTTTTTTATILLCIEVFTVTTAGESLWERRSAKSFVSAISPRRRSPCENINTRRRNLGDYMSFQAIAEDLVIFLHLHNVQLRWNFDGIGNHGLFYTGV